MAVLINVVTLLAYVYLLNSIPLLFEASGGITVFHVERANGFSSISGTKYNPSPHVLHIDCPMPPFMMGIIHVS